MLYSQGKSLEDGLPTMVTGDGRLPLNGHALSNDGHDNPCYSSTEGIGNGVQQPNYHPSDNMDALSHFTTQTEV